MSFLGSRIYVRQNIRLEARMTELSRILGILDYFRSFHKLIKTFKPDNFGKERIRKHDF